MTIWKCLKVSSPFFRCVHLVMVTLGRGSQISLGKLSAGLHCFKEGPEWKCIFQRQKNSFGKSLQCFPSTDVTLLPLLCSWCHTSFFSHLFCLPPYYFCFYCGFTWFFLYLRIALQEDSNRMSANALAIVFAPCILRCPDTIDPLQSVQDISKTTT